MTSGFLLADNIRAELARRRRTQNDLAKLLGLTSQSISRRLRGEVPFRDAELVAIAKFLKIDMAVLFAGLAAVQGKSA